ncbi:unnamed protein product [Auanema sp. JU1783]|nr:unnamed protein product [Auanema sp. JU1783]
MLRGLRSGYDVPYTGVEWNLVRTLFRSDKIEDLERCRDVMAMWRSRMGSDTPIAIMCSYQVLFVEIEERKLILRENYIGKEILQMLHCSAVIRFINYVNEINQTSYKSKSIVNSVESAGIPNWVVEVRHNASHAKFPRLETLRAANDFAYKWLWDNFWTKSADEAIRLAGIAGMANRDLEEEIRSEKTKEIETILYNYVNWKTTKGAKGLNTAYIPPEFGNLQKTMRCEPFFFIQVFAAENCLLLSQKQFEYARVESPTTAGWSVPFNLQKIWEPVFSLLDEIKVLGEATIVLLSHIRNNDSAYDYQAAAWASLIIEANAQPDVESFTEAEWSTVLYKMVACHDYFEPSLIQKVLNKLPRISQKRRSQVHRILNISTTTTSTLVDETMSVKTVEDLQMLIKKDAKEHSECAYKADKDTVLGFALGVIPGQTYETLSLSIDVEVLKKWDDEEKLKSVFSAKKKNFNYIFNETIEGC